MFDHTLFTEAAKKISEGLPSSLGSVTQEIRQYIQFALNDCILRLNLVTREEFDAQAQVLENTRLKLLELEKQIEALEKSHQLSSNPNP